MLAPIHDPAVGAGLAAEPPARSGSSSPSSSLTCWNLMTLRGIKEAGWARVWYGWERRTWRLSGLGMPAVPTRALEMGKISLGITRVVRGGRRNENFSGLRFSAERL